MRPTLRLRLTLLNGVLLVGAGAILVLLAWLLVRDALRPTDELLPGTTVVLTDGRTLDAGQWQRQLVDAASQELLVKGLLALVAISVVGVAGAYLVAGRALRPLHQVTATARRLGEATLDERIGWSGADDEVAELAETFDAMLDRISGAFEAQKRFVANASHELRTPLAVMRTEIDVTLSDDDADLAEYRRMAGVVRDASERANGLVDALLVLARSEAQTGRRLGRRAESDLAIGTANALSAVSREVERIGLKVHTSLRPAPVVGDPGLLDRLAGNLVENAVRYNHLHGRIWIRTGTDGERSWLVVGNTGFEVAPADVPGLFEPFRRGGQERTGARGSGLGLSIVRAVSDAHGGTVKAVAQPGGGLEVTVTLPSADPAAAT
ncbi:HAMP domain-containing sensor histidine kinase [Micromonospora aurantiaca]|uniref:histidine kinase n=1 Tax=Micromonospora aurantiaca (nom. illeg.) TaxID=47850 RepID=A0A6N3JZC3_9ACTN|nr:MULTISPECIES: HAMP domain-containing sensor histidine kinase [Micromonospora]ADL45172.1 ATP-binding region ATPase domain protein [Micromonospora aurantiaca ATCC 27029]ADU07405.1 integral membrane sensor signal transduction histidine kinase [Micromonospora sp. L5]AXH91298.1 sensor histidine kinase [Micromonospora aurantiaca]KAB1114764.1 HAMP domain-containing histidine kinase [Micromonospora aurantiaca]UFN97647.1 HAMP domain-containing histidine kinase [Micromonospora aurantiaca]